MGSPDHAVAPPPDRGGERLRAIARAFGEILITAGIVVLLFVFYVVYVTDWFSARRQDDADRRLQAKWDGPPARPAQSAEGEGFARLHIPSFGSDYRFTVLEGTDSATLAAGPGHYRNTALPGEQGNFSVAGHRIGKGAPFYDLDLLRSCDALVVETASDWFIYRVLPMREEVAGWNGHGGDATCKGVAPIGEPYELADGMRIVRPEQGEVIFPVPGKPQEWLPRDQQTRLITLTTCHPRLSAAQRLIVHGVLTKQYPKAPGRPDLRPPELEER